MYIPRRREEVRTGASQRYKIFATLKGVSRTPPGSYLTPRSILLFPQKPMKMWKTILFLVTLEISEGRFGDPAKAREIIEGGGPSSVSLPWRGRTEGPLEL